MSCVPLSLSLSLCPPSPLPPHLLLLPLLPLSFFEYLPVHLLSALGCYSTHPLKRFLIVRGGGRILTLPYPSVQIVPQMLRGGGDKSGLNSSRSSGTMLLFARKSRQTLATCCRALSCCKIAREGLQRGRGSHPCTLLLSYCPRQQSTVILPRVQCLSEP